MATIDKSILRAYDIRGVIGKTLFPEDAYHVARGFAAIARKRLGKDSLRIAVGFDGRLTSPDFYEHLKRGLLESGVEIINIGLCHSPMLYYSVFELDTDGGLMITASHNPKDYNGIKMMLEKNSFHGDDIVELGKVMEAEDYLDGEGVETFESMQPRYIERILSDLHMGDDIRIAWDCGNGATGNLMQELVTKMPGSHYLIHAEVDGNFPNHHPDPSKEENLQDLMDLVQREKCDFGIAFDGDGDRIGAVGRNRNIIWCDTLIYIYARRILKHKPNAKFIGDIKCSKIMFSEIEKLGGEAIMCQTGHSLVKTKLKETGADLAGEMSGHIFFADKYYGFDDAVYAALRLCNIISDRGESLAEMTAHLPETIKSPEYRVKCDDDKKFDIIESIKEKVTQDGLEYIDIDGVRVLDCEGWWLARASNTEGALTFVVEADTQACYEKLLNQINSYLKPYNIKL